MTALEGELNPGGDFKKTKLKVTWLADAAELVDLKLMDFDHLITKAKPEEDDVFEDLVRKGLLPASPRPAKAKP